MGAVSDLTRGSPAPVTSTRWPAAHTDGGGWRWTPAHRWTALFQAETGAQRGAPGVGAEQTGRCPCTGRWAVGLGAGREVGTGSQLPQRDKEPQGPAALPASELRSSGSTCLADVGTSGQAGALAGHGKVATVLPK